MGPNRCTCVLVILFCNYVVGQDIFKSSLTFVIDDTGSMYDDIKAVLIGANAIFDTVLKYNSSQIENFVLVTFNDPTASKILVTKDREEFKAALSAIDVDGGDDCPEYSMKGIQLALELSLPQSYLYVFTDATAHDYDKYKEVESLATVKQSQVVFVLTGDCYEPVSASGYKVYHDLAKTTNGEVFNLEKQEIGLILNYVINSIKGRTPTLVHVELPPGVNTISFIADPEIKDPTISMASADPARPTIFITAPDESHPSCKLLVDTSKILICEVNTTVPGNYSVQISSSSRMRVVVKARSDFNFRHGFSKKKPSSINHTSARPPPDVKSHLSIKLDGGAVELKAAALFDTSGTKIMEVPLILSDKKTKFYVTEPFNPPKTKFRLAVIGYHPASATNITRFAPTDIVTDVKLPEKIDSKIPSVVIEGAPKIKAEFDKTFELVCNVNGYPKANIVWKNINTGEILTGEMSLVELPYDYLSVLKIQKVTKNATYECEGSNSYGTDKKSVAVEVLEPERHFIVKETPKYVQIEYENDGTINCTVDAYPPALITWHRSGRTIVSGGAIEISPDNTTFTIKGAIPADEGQYICEATNEDKTKWIYKRVIVVGTEAPKIDKSVRNVYIKKGSSAVIECKLLKGIPKPTIKLRHKLGLNSKDSSVSQPWDEWEYRDTIVVNNASKNDSGIYECNAENDISDDTHTINVIVEYAPTIEEDVTLIKARVGSKVVINCRVDGGPTPDVTWFKDDIKITKTDGIFIYKDHILRIDAARPSDSGHYTCTATNRVATVSKKVKVEVEVPVIIKPPLDSDQTVLVGTTLSLPCEAYGVPKPEFLWVYYSFSKPSSKKIIRSKGDGPLTLEHIQVDGEGSYTCVATNSGGSKNITYEVKLFAPPLIENTYVDKNFVVVEGDLALRIMCKASGRPKPTITWHKDGWNLASGSIYYIEDETLIITNVPKDASGVYKCIAENSGGAVQDIYNVKVEDFPPISRRTTPLVIEQGKPTEIECKVPHTSIDQLRWYKNGVLIHTGELTLSNPSVSDSGTYTCRVTDLFKSANENVEVEIGYKPEFATEEDENIEINEAPVILVCDAYGTPIPLVTWYLEDERLNETESNYYFPSGIKTPGRYRCEVENAFGTISRTYIATPRDCFINIDKLTKLQPLMLTSGLTWPTFTKSENFMIFSKGDQFVLFCSNGFKTFPRNYVIAFCDGGTNFMINGEKYDYSKIQCKEEVKHVVQRTGERCLPGNTEKINIVYQVLRDESVKAYEICLDKSHNVPVYAMQHMSRSLADEDYKTTWSDSEQFHMNFEDLYDCRSQIYQIYKSLGRRYLTDKKCCFSQRQLVNPRDVFPGVAQKSTYSYFNVVPKWGTCNGNNWDDVEERVRNFAKSSFDDIKVWTGLAKKLSLSAANYTLTDNFFKDRKGNSQPVPKFFWKVVQDTASSSSLAIVHVNVPNVSPSKVYEYILCSDICDRTDWMNSPDWHDVTRGYTYCCSLPEFERNFGYKGVFDSSMTRVLTTTADYLPGSSLTV